MNKLLELIKDAATVAIAGHVRPDGDCVGSCLALYHYLRQNSNVEVTVYLEKPEGKLAKLPGAEVICSELPVEAQAELQAVLPAPDLFFALDCGDLERLGFAGEIFRKAGRTVCIDHHITNEGFADINHVVADASSTSEVLFELMDQEKIGFEAARCLYTGIIHDTGVFHHVCTGRRTMEIAGWLMEQGLDYSRIIDEEFYQRSYIQNQILGRCLMESILLWDGVGIVSYLARDVMNFYGVSSADLEGVIDQLRLTAGVEVAIFLHETEERQTFKVSMRANGEVDVSKVARYFGGGGHVKAAGCTMKGTAHDVINNLTEQLEPQLIEQGYVKDGNE